MTADPYRQWDAAYVLGALAPGERREYEEHLAGCDACRAAVGELAGMPALLAMVPAGDATGGAGGVGAAAGTGADGTGGTGADVVPLARLADAARRRRARGRLALAGAAAALVVLGGVAGSAVTAATTPAPVVAADARAVALTAVGGSGVTADVTLAPVRWGTRLDWTCAYAAAELPEGVYELVLVDAAGERTVVATWTSTGERTASGLGASSALRMDGIERVELGVVGLDRPLAVGEV
ncbi:anti-sigma factor family protein [Cellulomonas sp. S1-8]|uniref:anti-sigma factor family protein n=1 Tax=Cellulomonas sp. S1-8 TaxID=2904790 RepID=UPI002243350B|nr:zf-HC2 domain-containing protein [Cellulomonas sp. S1-8]UZN03241.1 zf-HC2 domain-containing protein [Cellulomonas sp. S1-8]